MPISQLAAPISAKACVQLAAVEPSLTNRQLPAVQSFVALFSFRQQLPRLPGFAFQLAMGWQDTGACPVLVFCPHLPSPFRPYPLGSAVLLWLALSGVVAPFCRAGAARQVSSAGSLRCFWVGTTVNPRRHLTQRSSSRGIVRVRAASELEAEPVTIDNSTVLVVGGGGLGMDVVRQLATAGSWITAFQRADKFRREIEGLGAMLAIGDVMAPETVERALRSNSFDAVVCTVGGGTQQIKVDSDGVINVIEACKRAGIKRFILVSSIGAGDSAVAVDEKTMLVLGPVLKEKERAEEHLKGSGLAWTIVRPGGLLTDAPTGKGVLTEDASVVGVITRADVASLIMKILFDKRAEEKILSAIDSEKKFPPMETKEIKEFVLA